MNGVSDWLQQLHINYGNSLLYDINEGLLNRLQRLQNAAARLIFNVRKFDHVTPLRRELHWLPIRQRIEFKLSSIMYKCQHNLAPAYLTACCTPIAAMAGRQHLRSAASFKVNVPRTRTKIGSRAFSVSGPAIWNSLPLELRDPGLSFDMFHKALKTTLFNRAYA